MTLIYNSLLQDLTRGLIVFGTDAFRLMLVTSTYVADETARDTHSKRSNITNEVSGTGYTAGGNITTTTINAIDTTNNRTTVTFGSVSWASSTITARGGVIYKARGGAATADELVLYVSFGGADIVSSGGTFQVTFSAPLTFQL
jgi:hypothetical protein